MIIIVGIMFINLCCGIYWNLWLFLFFFCYYGIIIIVVEIESY